MSARVLSTPQAKESVTRMQSIIGGGLTDTLRQLDAQGRQLSDPNIWDGALASEFRGSVWPETKTALDKMVQQLEELRGKVEVINQNIMSAGGNA